METHNYYHYYCYHNYCYKRNLVSAQGGSTAPLRSPSVRTTRAVQCTQTCSNHSQQTLPVAIPPRRSTAYTQHRTTHTESKLKRLKAITQRPTGRSILLCLIEGTVRRALAVTIYNRTHYTLEYNTVHTYIYNIQNRFARSHFCISLLHCQHCTHSYIQRVFRSLLYTICNYY